MPDVLTSLAIERFRADPEMARYNTAAPVGGCWTSSFRFAHFLTELGVDYRFRRWRNLPHLATDRQHNIECDGRIICWTHQQVDASASWPHVQPIDEYQALG